MAKKQKAIEVLLSRGLLDEKRIEGYILAGRVYADGVRVTGKGQLVSPACDIRVRGLDMPYLSKGGYKLAGALRDFSIDVRGRVCLDAGASTGGFTHCLLRHGAARVYAVDVGFGQMMGALAQDKRVVNLERTNISDEKLLSLTPAPTLGTVDLSYLSLRLGIPAFAAALRHAGELICLVKPLFETEDAAARRTGVLPDGAYEPLLGALTGDINRLPCARVLAVTHSPVTGNGGTREFFLHVALGNSPLAPPEPAALHRQISASVARALTLPVWQKPE